MSSTQLPAFCARADLRRGRGIPDARILWARNIGNFIRPAAACTLSRDLAVRSSCVIARWFPFIGVGTRRTPRPDGVCSCRGGRFCRAQTSLPCSTWGRMGACVSPRWLLGALTGWRLSDRTGVFPTMSVRPTFYAWRWGRAQRVSARRQFLDVRFVSNDGDWQRVLRYGRFSMSTGWRQSGHRSSFLTNDERVFHLAGWSTCLICGHVHGRASCAARRSACRERRNLWETNRRGPILTTHTRGAMPISKQAGLPFFQSST